MAMVSSPTTFNSRQACTETFEFVEDKAGDWLVHCHFPNQMEGGMMARYVVTN